MLFERYFPMQRELDRTIMERNKIHHSVTNEKILALLVEVAELANETRCFKYWSQKPPSKREVILEEYVDCLHFLLSIGNDFGYGYAFEKYTFYDNQERDLMNGLVNFADSIVEFKRSRTISNYLDMWDAFLQISVILKFNYKDIEMAYMSKHDENYRRQLSGY